jgi:hypothetical protein
VHPDFVTAIEGLYEAFASYERPASFIGCACCFDGEEIPRTADETFNGWVRVPSPGGATPLRSLGDSELGDFAFSVPLTSGDLDVYSHYLPRIFEIAATTGFEFFDAAFVIPQVNRLGRYTDWPVNEAQAIDDFLRAWWRDTISSSIGTRERDQRDTRADTALCAIGSTVADVRPYLDEWLGFATPFAALHLRAFLARNAGTAANGYLDNWWWNDPKPEQQINRDAIVAWVQAPETLEHVFAAIERARTPNEAAALEECVLRWLG